MSLEKHIRKNKEAFDDKKMPERSQPAFEQLLKKELHTSSKQKINPIKYLAVAASFALIFASGYFYNASIKAAEKENREQLLFSMNNETASERLQAVYDFGEDYKEDYKKEDERLIQRLFELLHNDSSNNVKIATVDALTKFPDNEEIRLQLIKALEKEKEPLVQIKLIQSLTVLREQRAKEPLQQIIEDKESFPVVRGNASLAMNKLKN
ncbi:hypothetical protein GTQ40_08780 [Flavobacteriaceae bacterium R38]|nr:hypothetical protein [Flavobacteriaceae bacterium R38]